MGSVWTSFAGSSGPAEASTSRTPNAPPQLLPMLAPSAPPQLEEGPVPSAPPPWEDEDTPEAIHASAPPLSSSSPNHSNENLHLDTSQPSQMFTSAVEEERNNDSDGAESTTSHSERNNRWSSSLRTGEQEGRGLPRYEP